jgi:DNA-binding CsgD family transcriptional regulator
VVLHIGLALYVVAFSLDVTLLILCAMAYARYQDGTLRDLTVLLCAVLLILTTAILKTYDKTSDADFSLLQPWIYAAFSAIGFGLLTYSVPHLCYGVIGEKVTPLLNAIIISFSVIVATFGALHEIMPSVPTMAITVLGLKGVQVYGACLVLPRLMKISSPSLRTLSRNLSWLFLVGVVATCIELALRALVDLPPFFQDFSPVQIIYCCAAGTMLLIYAFDNLFVAEHNPLIILPEPFIQKFGISPRERQIVSMMVQGYSNRRIGEELFISSITVKNHIYHIYQKTGVENKVQLINLLNQPK